MPDPGNRAKVRPIHTWIAFALPVIFVLLVAGILRFGERGDEAWLDFAFAYFCAAPVVGWILYFTARQRKEPLQGLRVVVGTLNGLWTLGVLVVLLMGQLMKGLRLYSVALPGCIMAGFLLGPARTFA